MPTVHIEPQGWHVEAAPDVTIMKAARAVGIRLPRSCQNGTCRACLCPLLQGSVNYTVAWPGITEDERVQGLVLPCVACATSDVVIEAPNAVQIDPP
jgi:ferredoxin